MGRVIQLIIAMLGKYHISSISLTTPELFIMLKLNTRENNNVPIVLMQFINIEMVVQRKDLGQVLNCQTMI